MTPKQKRFAIYARVSTQEQDPGMQLSELRAYALARGYAVVEEFVDRESGATETRPALDQLMRLARSRKVDGVLVWKFDRFGRSTRHLITTLHEFQDLGVDFISLTEQMDTGSPAGKALFTMASAFAEFERSLISERVKAGMVRARARGKRIGRPPLPKDKQDEILALKATLSQRQIAKATGVPRGTVSRFLWEHQRGLRRAS